MGSSSNGVRDVDIEAQQIPEIPKPWVPNGDRLAWMRRNISENPGLPSRPDGKTLPSIFRVPTSLVEVNGSSYQPRIVSIGPYHRGGKKFEMIQEHKWRYLGSLLSRMENVISLEDIMRAIGPLVPKARECYSEAIDLDTDEFVEMMVLDGCFQIELFRKMNGLVKFEAKDPLRTMGWIFPFFYRDFLRLENQIPYFILEKLFELTKLVKSPESDHSLAELALKFFNYTMLRSPKDIENYYRISGKHHLLDLVRSSYIPQVIQKFEPPKQSSSVPTHVIHCVSNLRRAGIKVRQDSDKNESFLVVRFRGGVLEMPTITMDDFMSSFLPNCVAFEQCHGSSSKHFTTYAILLDSLVNTHKDVAYLCDRNIIENHLGTDSELAMFINKMGKDVAVDHGECYLSRLFKEVHEYYDNTWHVQWASFKYTYFDTPWSFISALAALVLLLLTMTQTLYTVYQVYAPKRG